ncbi:MAG: amidase [Spirochaetia bacterium]|jgi:Asp-tRNA(Asn)/Glu-tRNA(Gln) amidotransferase A subunit family amidase
MAAPLLPEAADPLNAIITRTTLPANPPRAGILAGRTLLVKDLIDTAGIRTTYGSNLYCEHVPTRNATVVERALRAGAVLVGKANMPEFAWSVLGKNPWYGTVHNPAQPGRTTGGSSAGNAAALAAGLVELGIGSDTGCSIRLPSAACGTVGLKSRWGVIPRDGIFPLAPTYDTVGPMARTVADVALLWSVLAERPIPKPRLRGLTVGLLRQPPQIGDGRPTEKSDRAEQWAADLKRLGARVVEARIPDATANTYAVVLHEALQSHAATFPQRAGEYGEVMRRKLEGAQKVKPDDVAAAYRAVEEWRRYLPEADLFISPCIAVELPSEEADEQEIRLPLSSFMRWVNLIGWAGLAIGNMQIVAPHDETVLAAGLAFEQG